jgi:hypothetical protein
VRTAVPPGRLSHDKEVRLKARIYRVCFAVAAIAALVEALGAGRKF